MVNLNQANIGQEYLIKAIDTNDDEIKSFLFTLGCYSGEMVTVVANKKNNLVVSLKDARYNIDCELAVIIKI